MTGLCRVINDTCLVEFVLDTSVKGGEGPQGRNLKWKKSCFSRGMEVEIIGQELPQMGANRISSSGFSDLAGLERRAKTPDAGWRAQLLQPTSHYLN